MRELRNAGSAGAGCAANAWVDLRPARWLIERWATAHYERRSSKRQLR
jgi:hypothetical protein